MECGNQIQTRLNSFDLFGLRLFASFDCELRFSNAGEHHHGVIVKVCSNDDVIFNEGMGLVQRYKGMAKYFASIWTHPPLQGLFDTGFKLSSTSPLTRMFSSLTS